MLKKYTEHAAAHAAAQAKYGLPGRRTPEQQEATRLRLIELGWGDQYDPNETLPEPVVHSSKSPRPRQRRYDPTR